MKYVIETHTHADRNSASNYFASEFGLEGIVKSEMTKYKGKKLGTKDGDILKVGNTELKVLYTPGHTYDHNSYLIEDNLLSGDCLFIGDVGRIDLGGDLREKTEMLYNSLRKLEQLPANTKVYPNHVGAVHAIDSEDKFSASFSSINPILDSAGMISALTTLYLVSSALVVNSISSSLFPVSYGSFWASFF